MADEKISGLPLAADLDGSELIELVQAGGNVQSTVNAVKLPYAYWSFAANGGAYPTNISKLYITTDDTVLLFNTWFVSDGSGGWLTK